MMATPPGSTTPESNSIGSSKYTLYDMPVSNNGARCRIILYKKEISSMEVQILKPSEIGGLRSETYRQINPLGKMPSLVCHEEDNGLESLAESDTIARYLLSTYAHVGPSFQPDHPISNWIARVHDMYMTTIQGCMYRPPPFGPFGTRKEALLEYRTQLFFLETLMQQDITTESTMGTYLCGAEVSYADATLFPSFVFASYMLPKFNNIFPEEEPLLPPKLLAWFENLTLHDPAFARVYQEMMEALQGWEQNGRWNGLLGAGWRDEEPATLFDRILNGEIPAALVEQSDKKILAFRDISPAAPAHVLLIPKDRNGLTRLGKATREHAEILGRLMVAAAEISRDTSLGFGDGARIVINDGPDGGQEVMHLHVHVLGGRNMEWPPG